MADQYKVRISNIWYDLLDRYTKEEVDDLLAPKLEASDLSPYNIENGFENRDDSTISFDEGTRTFAIEPTGDSFKFTSGGTEFVANAQETIQITNADGGWYIYYDETGSLQATQTFSIDLIETYAYVAFLYWKATGHLVTFCDERHGRVMSYMTHKYLHNTVSTQYGDGCLPDSIVADGTGNLDTEAQFGIGPGTIWDEDNELTLIADAAPASIPILYRWGAWGPWDILPATNFLCATTGTGRGAYNRLVATTWSIAEVDNTNFFLMHLFATNDIQSGYLFIMGQAQYTNKNDAQEAALTEIFSIETEGLPIEEFKSVATFILQTNNSYSNSVKSRVVSTADGSDFIDWRFTNSGFLVGNTGNGDMLRSVYDTDGNSIVDAAEILNDGVHTASAEAVSDHIDGTTSDPHPEYAELAVNEIVTGEWRYTKHLDLAVSLNIGDDLRIYHDPATPGNYIEAENSILYIDQVTAAGDKNIFLRVHDGVSLYSRIACGPTAVNLYAGANQLKLKTQPNGTNSLLYDDWEVRGRLFAEDDDVPGDFIRADTTNGNTEKAAISIRRTYDGGAGADGIGVRIDGYVETETEGLSEFVGCIGWRATDATAGTVDADGHLDVVKDGATVEAITAKSDGSVGIGVTDPLQPLHIARTNTNAAISLELNGTISQDWIIRNQSDDGTLQFHSDFLGAGSKIPVRVGPTANSNLLLVGMSDASTLDPDGVTIAGNFIADSVGVKLRAGATNVLKLEAKDGAASELSGDWALVGGSLTIPDNEDLVLGDNSDILVRHSSAGPFNFISAKNANLYIDQADTGGAKSTYLRVHDGTAARNRFFANANGARLYAGASIQKLRTYDGTASELNGDWDCDSLLSADHMEATGAYTVATLPTPVIGMIARVTDASSPAVGSTVTGGGAAAALVWYNGSNWNVIGV